MSNHVMLPGYILARQVYELSYLNGIQEKITETNKISADFIENGDTNKVVTSTDIANWNAKVSPSELSAQSYVTSAQLDLASYISSFEESDPTVPAYVKSITENDIANWNAAQSSSLVETTYSELVSLINDDELKSGTMYRITDYATTTSYANTSSAGKQFDLIVTAISENELSEDAKAINHEAENFTDPFASSNVVSWDIKYSINNDTTRFTWADATNGKGVIYWMRDEHGNECNYDFKNIMFSFPSATASFVDTSKQYYTFSNVDNGTVSDATVGSSSPSLNKINVGQKFLPFLAIICSSGSIGDFNTIGYADNVLVNGNSFSENKIGRVENCVFDHGTITNVINEIYNTTIGNSCMNNVIKYMSGCSIGVSCAYNNIGRVTNITAVDGFMMNTIGDSVSNLNVGTYFYGNEIGNYCADFIAGYMCYGNVFQTMVHHVTMGDYCYINKFFSNVNNIRMGNYCFSNIFENGYYIYFGNTSNQGADWICYNRFLGATQYIYFYNTGTANSDNQLRKYHLYNICGYSNQYKEVTGLTRQNASELFILTRPGYATPAANSLIFVDPAMIPEKMKGGLTGQFLKKNSNTDYDVSWADMTIPTKLSDLTNDVSYITQAELSANAYLTEHQSLDAYPTKAELSAQGYLTSIPSEYITQAELSANGYLTSHQDLTTYAKKTDAIGSLTLSLDSTNYKVTLSGTKVDGTAFTVDNVIDLPLESVVVSGYYDSTNKKVALTLENGSVVDFSVADLVNGLQSEITISNKLSSDLIDDTNKTHKFVTSADIDSWNERVTKAELSAQAYIQSIPSEYITQAELSANAYLTEHQSLDAYPTKAELSAQSYLKSFTETDPVFTASAAHDITSSDINSWNDKVSKEDLVSQSYVTSDQLSAQSYAGYSYVYSAYTYIINQIVDNELVIAAALTETNERIINLENAGYLTSFTESDPTVPAYVKSITEANISNWNDKVSKAELSAQGYITSIPSEYITQAELSANTYLTEHQSLDAYPTKAELSAQGYFKSIPDEYITQAELSANAYLTEHQSLAAYPTKAELSAQGYIKSIPNEYITQAELSANAYLTEHQSLAAYPTKAELSAQGYLKSIPDEYITQAELSANTYLTEHQSLAAYPTKAELSAQAYLKAVPAEYVTQAELSANGYLTAHQDLTTYAKKSDAIGSLSLSLNSSDYKITLSGTKVDGTLFTVSNVIDLPLESVVVSGYYDSTNKKVALTLENGSVVDFSVADLVNGLQSEITSSNKLSADLVQDGSTNKVVTATEKADWNSRVTKAELSAQAYLKAVPSEYVTQAELSANAYLTEHQSLAAYPTKAELSAQAYIKSETDPVFAASAAHGITSNDITKWNSGVTKAELSEQAYLKTIPAEYVTQAELSANAYLTEHQSLAVYPTKAELSAQAYLKSETDPVFVASAAHGITSNDITKWNSGVTKEELVEQAYLQTESNGILKLSDVNGTMYNTDFNAASSEDTDTIRFIAGTNTSVEINSASKMYPARVTISAYNCLPTVSSTDNGKVLQVVNGAWALVTPISVYTGSGEPSNSIGNNGDLYMQTI